MQQLKIIILFGVATFGGENLLKTRRVAYLKGCLIRGCTVVLTLWRMDRSEVKPAALHEGGAQTTCAVDLHA